MNIKQIEGFCYLAQTLNFSEAAERLFISQPAFSRMIVRLEEELGCQLFQRSKVEPRLTLAGERVYRHMKSIVRAYEDVCQIASMATRGELGYLRIGMLSNGLTETARKLIVQFRNLYPNLTLELKEYSELELFRALEMDWVDIAFVIHFPESFRDKIEGIVVETARDCVAVHRSNPLASKESIEVSELRDEPFIVIRKNKSEGYNHVVNLCAAHGFAPKIVTKADSAAGAMSAVDCGLGCTIIVESIREIASESTVLIPLKDVSENHYTAVWNREQVNPWVGTFSAYLQEQGLRFADECK